MDDLLKIVLIGSGNVATRLAAAMLNKGVLPVQIFSRRKVCAEILSKSLGGAPLATDNLGDLCRDADLYLIAVSDAAIPEVVANLPDINGIPVHTAGSVSMDVFAGRYRDCGVLYPLQTFSKSRAVVFDHIPLYVEASTDHARMRITRFAEMLSDTVCDIDAEGREVLHLAAVFVCNFANHLYAIGDDLLSRSGLSAEALFPLMREMTEKACVLPAKAAQTGPAVRCDASTMIRHLDRLKNLPMQADIYRLLSKSITQTKLISNREQYPF